MIAVRSPVRGRRPSVVAAAVVVVAGVLLALPGFLQEAPPTPDGLFYEVHVGILEGSPSEAAYHAVFTGERARAVAAVTDAPTGWVRILDPAWVEYSSQFYERRWFVPALAAAVRSAGGTDAATALRVTSMLGYSLVGIALFGLLRQRFRADVSAVVAIGCLCCPVLWRWSFSEGVDSWGLVLEILGLLSLVLIADRGPRWLWLWIVSVALLSLTRDATVVLGVGAVALLAAQWRLPGTRRRNLLVVVSGAVAALPAPLFLGAPLTSSLAYAMNRYRIPSDAGWGFVVQHYGGQVVHTLVSDAMAPSADGFLGVLTYVMIAVAIVGMLALFVPWAGPGVMTVLGRASAVGAAAVVLLAASPQDLRIELTFVPAAALGVATVLTRWAPGRVSARSTRALEDIGASPR